MTENAAFRELFDSARSSFPYRVEKAIIGFTEQVIGRIEILDLSRTDFAARLESSPAYVTKMLRGETNFTLESMVKVSDALNCELEVKLVPKLGVESWVSVIDKKFPIQQPKHQEIQVWQMNDFQSVLPRAGNLFSHGQTAIQTSQLILRDEYTTNTAW